MYMALHIQEPETDRRARQLSAATGETITQAVRAALRDRLECVQPVADQEQHLARIKEITSKVAAMPILDHRSEDEILGYNDQGLFD
jgi:antitoxin VapB